MANTYFTDRVVQYPGRVTMTPTGNTNEYDLARAEGNVTTPGTPFNADAFNGIANDIIADAVNEVITAIAGKFDAVNKTLWTGEFAGGSIIVPNTADYSVFIAYLTVGGGLIGIKNASGTGIDFIRGSQIATSNNQYIDVVSCQIDGNTWTMKNKTEMGHVASGNHEAPAVIKVARIVGVVPNWGGGTA